MSRRCQSVRSFAKKQRVVARGREWQGFTPEEQNLLVRRLATRAQIRKARRNAELLAKLQVSDKEVAAANAAKEAA